MSGDLASWLLEQIAADAAPTFELIAYRCEPDCCAPAGWVGHRCLICGTEEYGGTVEAITGIALEHDEKIHQRTRRLAERDSKLSAVVKLGAAHHASTVWLTRDRDTILRITDEALRALALPYADREGYREEWRP